MSNQYQSDNLSLSSLLESLTIQSDCLPFNLPPGFDRKVQVPRYLYRVFSRNSAAYTDEVWAESVAARYLAPSRTKCIFTLDKSRAADMINGHMRWHRDDEDDNLFSWTSSMLYALVNIFYRRARYNEKMSDIFFCVIDTNTFPKDTFIAEVDLAAAFRRYNSQLQFFANRQNTTHSKYSGAYYFGEFLSQGALKIEGQCEIVDAKRMERCGLLDMHPRFPEFLEWPTYHNGRKDTMSRWAHLVIELREPFYQRNPEKNKTQAPRHITDGCVKIGRLFGSKFQLPIALSLFSLVPDRGNAALILLGCGTHVMFEEDYFEYACGSVAAIDTYVKLPELFEVERNAYTAYFRLYDVVICETIEKARKSLQYAQQLTKMRVIEGAASGGLEIIPTRLGEVLEELKLLENMVLPFHGSSEEEYWKKFV